MHGTRASLSEPKCLRTEPTLVHCLCCAGMWEANSGRGAGCSNQGYHTGQLPQNLPLAAISSRSRAARSCGVSFLIASVCATATDASASAPAASASSAALRQSPRPLPASSAVVIALKARSYFLMMVHAMSAEYLVTSCCFWAGSGGEQRSRIPPSSFRSSLAPSALPYASASAMRPDMATTARASTCDCWTKTPGCCTASSSYTTTRGPFSPEATS
mmetsp:Transcript_13489/g.30615  ORF Transcript_13489/g.30615 Transcript_13489/m.30615 type:complete len:217 (+) Transcript_13489:213-863(+)